MLTREPVTELFNWGRLLLLSNLLVLLLVRRRFETLPWQAPTEEVHEDMAQRLQVISTRLLASQVRVDRHVPGSA